MRSLRSCEFSKNVFENLHNLNDIDERNKMLNIASGVKVVNKNLQPS